HLSDFAAAEPVDDGHLADGPAVAGLALDLGELAFGHCGIRLVVEGFGYVVAGQVADGAQEEHDAAAAGAAHRLGQGGVVDRLIGQTDHLQPPADSFRTVRGPKAFYPPLTGGSRAISASTDSGWSFSANSPATASADRARSVA